MSYLCKEIINETKGLVIANEPQELNSITASDCAAVLWNRQLPSDFQAWIANLPPQILPEGRFILPLNEIEDAVLQLCKTANMPDGCKREFLIEDIKRLSHLFADIMKVNYLRIRLEKVDDNACSKFHKDTIKARLVCTYRGKGTQYGTSINGCEPDKIFTASTGTPILLRGTLLPENPPSYLLHRSPPIEGTGETRLVLVLDPIYDLDGEI